MLAVVSALSGFDPHVCAPRLHSQNAPYPLFAQMLRNLRGS
jgi:hypothetical protein